MIRHGRNSPVRGRVRRPVLAVLVIVMSGAIAPPRADANVNAGTAHRGMWGTLITGDGQGDDNAVRLRTGNGKFNRNFASVLSPTVNRGLQQIASTNVSGSTNNQVAFCHKKHRVCKIRQRLWNSWP
jgi:hypothetical protein